ncbi:phage tail protein [Macrococcus equi]|uniref:phage tail protein n=1 Tax=Macrococcus equi TaxID=3395462 RepID=UPI0039BDD7B8
MDINSIKTKVKQHKHITIKQKDNTSPIELILCGADGKPLSNLSGDATVTLLDTKDRQVRATITGQVESGVLTFVVTQHLKANKHSVEVTIGGKKFPSNGEFFIQVAWTHDQYELNIISSQTVTTVMNGLYDKIVAYMNANPTLFKGKDGINGLNGLNGKDADPTLVANMLQPNIATQVQNEFNKLSANQQSNTEIVESRQGYPTLNDAMLLNSQVDFVDKLTSLTGIYGKGALFVENVSTQTLKYVQPLTPSRAVAYWFYKNAKDDYVIALQSEVGDYTNEPRTVGFQNLTMVGDASQFNTTYPPNYYATTVGATLYGEVTADQVNFVHYKTSTGGLWEVILDEGTVQERRTTVSTYNSTAIAEQEAILFTGLEWKKHTLKFIFKGQDPANPVSSPRGWFYYNTPERPQYPKATIGINKLVPIISNVQKQLYSVSNKEFAFRIRDAATTSGEQFFPEHNSIGTAFKNADIQVLVDGKQIEWIGGKVYPDVTTLQIIQDVNARINNVDLLKQLTIHTIKNGNMTIAGQVTALKDTYFLTGYIGMIPYFTDQVDIIKTSLGNKYNPDTAVTAPTNRYISEDLKAISYLLCNSRNNLVTAVTFEDFISSMRIKLNNAKGDTWIEDRNASMGKIYNQQFKEEIMLAGQVFNYRVTFKTTELSRAKDLF